MIRQMQSGGVPKSAQKYVYSVIEVASALHDVLIGSADGMSPETMKHFVDWLRWRVNDAWIEPYKVASCAAVDDAVRAFARAVLDEHDAEAVLRRARAR